MAENSVFLSLVTLTFALDL